MLKISSSATSNAGKKKINEDNFYMNGVFIAENNASAGRIYSDSTQRDTQFYAVFDGLDQDIKSDINQNIDFFEGETASFAAADMLSRLQRHLKTREKYNLSERVYSFTKITNRNICEYMKQKGLRTGTSFALLCINGNSAYIYNIGNCKIFLLRDNRLVLVSQNDTKAESLVLAKQISSDIVRHTPDNKILTQYLGMFENEKNLDLHVNRVNLKNGDKFLVCSDGLCDLSNERIYQIMSRDMSEQEIVTDLINESMRNGESGGDNLTVIVVGVNYSDETSSKANLLKPTSDGPTHFSPIKFRNKFELKPKHIKQIILYAGLLVIFIVAISILFRGLFKPSDTNPAGESGNNASENQTSGQNITEDSNNAVNTGNIVITTETTTFDIATYDPDATQDETSSEESTQPTEAPVQTTAAPVVQNTTPPAPTDPPPTNPPETTEAPDPATADETPTEAPATEPPTESTELPTEEPTESPTESETEPPTEEPTEPPTDAPTEEGPPVEPEPEPDTVAEPEPPTVAEIEEETIAAE
ncbi:MAG: hypothetical protein FWF92_09695 [Oscillospiraceae bacterium]|nr:hypothetical protein [Oscillospiraceae bacterium]